TVNTVPEPGVRDLTGLIAGARRLLDVLYDPWPTSAGAAAQAAGVPVIGGDVMLLNQAFGQVELFTGLPAPRDELAAALAEALGRPCPRRCRDADRAGLMCPGDASRGMIDPVMKWTTAGESHGQALVTIIEGVIAGVEVTRE